MELHEQSQAVEGTVTDQTLNDESATTTNLTKETTIDNKHADIASTASKAQSKAEAIERLSVIAELPAAEITRDSIDSLKQSFYAFRKAELEQEKADFMAKGNEESAFAPMPDPLEEQLHQLLNDIKAKRAKYVAEQEALLQANLEKKLAIIDELSTMAEDTDNVNKHFNRFKELQQEFKTSGAVPQTNDTEVWKKYQSTVERFYDQLKINKDLRDYDFKKNLEQKQLLIDEAEKLDGENDIIIAFRRLQELHSKWRETGPVAKELREDIWNRFKDTSANINKKYQAFFEERKAREQENETAKTAICEKLEALNFDELKTFAAWDEMTKTILAAQEDWKKLGFASKKVNNALFARFRETCDKFFESKAAYFKQVKDDLASNLEKKIALCERAEALKDSTDWKKTGDEFIALQKEWRTIGSVAKKHSDAVWRRFLDACDYFFEQRKKNTSGTRRAEQANLKQKLDIIDRLKAIDDTLTRDNAIATVKNLMAQWQQVGHVPFKEKDKVYDAYRAIVNELYDRLDIRETKAHFSNFENSISEMDGDKNKLFRERERLARSYEQKRNELKNYETNLCFFNAKSKSGSSMLRDIERKIQHINEDLATLEKKIELIDSKLQ